MAEWIHCPAPLPEEPAGPLLTNMLVLAPYRAPKKEANKKAKETRSGLRRRGASDTKSEDSSDAPSSGENEEGEEDEEEEDDEEEEEPESPTRGRKKRTTSSSLEANSSKRGRTLIPEASTTATDSSPEWDPRAQPLVNS